MKVNFQFNDQNKVVLTPESPREVQLIKLAFLNERTKPYLDFHISEGAEITLILVESRHARVGEPKDIIIREHEKT